MSLTTYREVCNELLNGLDELQDPRYPFPGYITAAMDRARELLAQPALAEPPVFALQRTQPPHPTPARLRHCPTHGQQPPEAWGCPECVRELREELAALRTPPADGEVGELVDFLERLGSDHDIRGLRAAELLQQQAAELAALRRQVVPVSVRERLPNLSPQGGDFNDAGLLWWFIPKLGWRMCSRDAVDCIPYPTHWLPFHALPLPSREVGND